MPSKKEDPVPIPAVGGVVGFRETVAFKAGSRQRRHANAYPLKCSCLPGRGVQDCNQTAPHWRGVELRYSSARARLRKNKLGTTQRSGQGIMATPHTPSKTARTSTRTTLVIDQTGIQLQGLEGLVPVGEMGRGVLSVEVPIWKSTLQREASWHRGHRTPQ